MKIIYTILSFVGLASLVGFSFSFLKLMDINESGIKLAEAITGIFVSLLLLVFLLYKYVKLTSKNDTDDLF